MEQSAVNAIPEDLNDYVSVLEILTEEALEEVLTTNAKGTPEERNDLREELQRQKDLIQKTHQRLHDELMEFVLQQQRDIEERLR